jgi:preprotein translocase subunit SecE
MRIIIRMGFWTWVVRKVVCPGRKEVFGIFVVVLDLVVFCHCFHSCLDYSLDLGLGPPPSYLG